MKVLVTIPILGVATIETDVSDDATDDEIFDAATEAFDQETDQWEWDFKSKIVEGNVFHGYQNEWEYEKLEDEEDDDEQEEQAEEGEH